MNSSQNVKSEVSAFAKSVRMSPNKVRRILEQIKGRSYEEALMILEFMPYRACEPILKVLYSAAANGKHNLGFNKSRLSISEASVDQGPVMKRFRPRAQGRGFPRLKPTCHIKIALQNKQTDLKEV